MSIDDLDCFFGGVGGWYKVVFTKFLVGWFVKFLHDYSYFEKFFGEFYCFFLLLL